MTIVPALVAIVLGAALIVAFEGGIWLFVYRRQPKPDRTKPYWEIERNVNVITANVAVIIANVAVSGLATLIRLVRS